MSLSEIEILLNSGSPLSKSDCEELRAIIQNGNPTQVDHALLLLHAKPSETNVCLADRPLLEKAFDDGPKTARAAHPLSLLCNWLSLAHEQRDRILTGLTSHSEDDGDYLCITACVWAGALLQKHHDEQVAKALVAVYEDQSRPAGTRESACRGLLKSSGMSSRDIHAAKGENPNALRASASSIADKLIGRVTK